MIVITFRIYVNTLGNKNIYKKGDKMNLCVLIMAGERDTRVWPLSTGAKPKQFLRVISENTLLQMTVNRIKDAIPMERIFICTEQRYTELLKEQLPNLPERNIIVEPKRRNTASCIALAAMIINRYYKKYNMSRYL